MRRAATAVANVTDSFNRANSTSSLGSTDTGQAWTAHRGTLGINTNAAYLFNWTTDDQNIASVESGRADLTLACTVSVNPVASSGVGLVYRLTDANNYRFFFHYRNSGNTAFLAYSGRCEAGVVTYDHLSGTDSIGSLTAPFDLKVVAEGSTIKVYRNGVKLGSDLTSTFNQTATRHGIFVSNSQTQRIDSLSIIAPPAPPILATATLRPSGVLYDGSEGGGPVWLAQPSGTLVGVITDDSDASYALARSGDSGAGDADNTITLGADLTTFSFGAATIESVAVRVRASSAVGELVDVWVAESGGSAGPADSHALTGSTVTYTGTARTTKPSGGAWTQAAIDGLQVFVNPNLVFDGGESISLYEVYVDVVYAT